MASKTYDLCSKNTGKQIDSGKEATEGETAAEKNPDDKEGNTVTKFQFDPVLLRYKLFFFLFFAGFGTTFPFLGIYFKQIGLSASSVGILAGIRPLIQCISGPFWAVLADKYRARKLVLLFSIFAWLVMTVLLAFPRPHHEVCRKVNKTGVHSGKYDENAQKNSLVPFAPNRFFHAQTGAFFPLPSCFPKCQVNSGGRRRRNVNSGGQNATNNNVDFAGKETTNNYINASSKNSNFDNITITYIIERNPKELRDIFIMLLILIVAGEFLEAPSFIMTDTALLEHLGEQRAQYGKTRLFGSLGYGVASFGIGALLDKTNYEYCGKTLVNYTILFYIFAAFMIAAFLFAMFGITFTYQKSDERPSTKEVLKLFCTLKLGSFLVVAWFMGFTHGGIMNFLNWYLEDLGATRLLMGIGTLCRASAIVVGFSFSNFFINKFGHINMILFALVAYTLSFFGYSVIKNPWYALPIETAQGLCYSLSWSACITYLGATAPPSSTATVQGMYVSGIYQTLNITFNKGTFVICSRQSPENITVARSLTRGSFVEQ